MFDGLFEFVNLQWPLGASDPLEGPSSDFGLPGRFLKFEEYTSVSFGQSLRQISQNFTNELRWSLAEFFQLKVDPKKPAQYQ